jgi:hypothetical protein
MATIEVKEPQAQTTTGFESSQIPDPWLDNDIAPENNLPLEINANDFTPQNLEQVMKNKGVERVPIIDGAQQQTIDPMTIDPRILYQTAEKYEIAAQKMGQLRDGFAQQAQDTEQKRLALELSYKKSAKPFGVAETTAATVAGAVIVPKLGEIILDNVYNPEKMAQDGLNAAVDAMGKKTNLNPLNWFSNLVNGSHTVEAMQEAVANNVEKISGSSLAGAITNTTDELIYNSHNNGKFLGQLDDKLNNVSKYLGKSKAKTGQACGEVAKRVEQLTKKVPNIEIKSEITQEITDLAQQARDFVPVEGANNDSALLNGVREGLETIKEKVIPKSGVDGTALGTAKEIKEKIIKESGGINNLAEKAKKDLEGNKIAKGMMWARDNFQNADKKVQTAIVAGVAILGATLAYLGVEHVNKQRQENLNHIDEQKVATEAEQQLWTQRIESANEHVNQSRTAANNIVKLGDFRTRVEQEKTNSTLAIT